MKRGEKQDVDKEHSVLRHSCPSPSVNEKTRMKERRRMVKMLMRREKEVHEDRKEEGRTEVKE